MTTLYEFKVWDDHGIELLFTKWFPAVPAIDDVIEHRFGRRLAKFIVLDVEPEHCRIRIVVSTESMRHARFYGPRNIPRFWTPWTMKFGVKMETVPLCWDKY